MQTLTATTLILFLMTGSAIADSRTWMPVKTVEVDWNHDGKKDRIILEAIKEFVDTEPGDFHRVRIQIAGRPQFVLENDEGWVRFEASAAKRYKSILSSDCFALTPLSTARNSESILLLFGYQYASSPGKLYVLSLDQSGDPKVVFDYEFELLSIDDIDDNNIFELIGYPQYSEAFGPDYTFQTYVPHYVYSIKKIKGQNKLELNMSLSKKYNEKHNYGWIEPDNSHEYVVFVPKDGNGSRLMKRKEAERIIKKISK